MSTERSLIGITGLARSGKSEMVRHMSVLRGYDAVVASDVLRASLIRETGHEQFGRDELRKKGDEMRRLYGPDFIVRHALELPSERIVIDGLRNLAAIHTLRRYGGILIGLVADTEVRFQRDQRAADRKFHYTTVEEMIEDEAKEARSTDPHSLGVLDALDMVDAAHLIDTTELSISEARARIDAILALQTYC